MALANQVMKYRSYLVRRRRTNDAHPNISREHAYNTPQDEEHAISALQNALSALCAACSVRKETRPHARNPMREILSDGAVQTPAVHL